MNLGPILFAAPGAFLALLALPALWWLMRATPPPPQRTPFPPARLLQGVQTQEHARDRAPWWLLLLRALAATLLILAFARPTLSPGAFVQSGRTLIVIDDGWPTAPNWSEARDVAIAAASEAERAGAPVFLLLTAPNTPPRDPGEALTGADARALITRLEPKPWRPDRADAAQRLARSQAKYDRIVWISDGLDDSGAQALASELQQRGPVSAYLPASTARALISSAVTPEGVVVEARRAGNGPASGAVAAETADGRALGAGELRFRGDELSARARIALPPEIAARAARVRIVGEQGAGAVRLLPAGSARPFVGLIDPGGAGQPLLSDLFYIQRALSPYASLQRGSVEQMLDARAQALVLPDAGQISPLDSAAIEQWVERGGLLVRFAGPRLANNPADRLLPVRLRQGVRSFGGALAWEAPLAIGAFPQDSPFAGLAPPADVAVRMQVLAEPSSLLEAKMWAALSDQSPLVTARARGRGMIVLFHVSATPAWSDLPLSGVFVETLRRTLAFAGRDAGADPDEIVGGQFVALRMLDGFGALSAAPADIRPIAPDAFALAQPSPTTPPGLYERGGVSDAIQAVRADESLSQLSLPPAIARAGLGAGAERPLAGWLFAAAAIFLAADLLVALLLAGRLPRLRRTSAALLLLLAAGSIEQAHAQNAATDPTQALRLGYVRTGEPRLDRLSAAGLAALGQALSERTSVEPGAPAAINLESDDLSAYPFIYWPAPSAPRRLSDRALANIDRYLAIGGLLLVDTRDNGRADARPAAVMLDGVDAPPLEPVTEQHVVARAFYLMRNFPGRVANTQLWAETALAASARDGVASIFIGNGDWAAAWAGAGGEREPALRFGINLVMVALVGNYKADQVHVPALLERMGEPR
ncbi:MAG: DUF4159 domain-containing protein [Terricaulis sp.]